MLQNMQFHTTKIVYQRSYIVNLNDLWHAINKIPYKIVYNIEIDEGSLHVNFAQLFSKIVFPLKCLKFQYHRLYLPPSHLSQILLALWRNNQFHHLLFLLCGRVVVETLQSMVVRDQQTRRDNRCLSGKIQLTLVQNNPEILDTISLRDIAFRSQKVQWEQASDMVLSYLSACCNKTLKMCFNVGSSVSSIPFEKATTRRANWSKLVVIKPISGCVYIACFTLIITSLLHSQKRASCSKSAAGLLPCCHQADIRMRSHRLLRLDDNKSAASCQQAWCKFIVKTFYPQAWCKLFQQLAASLQI